MDALNEVAPCQGLITESVDCMSRVHNPPHLKIYDVRDKKCLRNGKQFLYFVFAASIHGENID